VADIVQLFQEGKDGVESEKGDVVPQILVGSTALISTGLTLTAARYAVIFDAEWMARDEQQGIHRVSRIGQDRTTNSIKFVNADSKLDMAIFDRQGARRKMLAMVEGERGSSDREKLTEAQEENINETLDEEGNIVIFV
jgi:SNF2 family DNA or RNA helicase